MAALEDREAVRRRELAIKKPHLDVVEILLTRSPEQSEGNRGARRRIGVSGTRRDDARERLVGEGELQRDACAAREAGEIEPLRIE